jgi:nucleoside-diphosphate-sugar epimerase
MSVTVITLTWRFLMRVFLTGASGFIGSATLLDLIDAGHDVVGLARSDASATAIAAAGAEVHRGSLDDLDSLRSGAADSDGVIHTAFIHDFSNIAASGPVDRRAIEVMGAELEGSDRPLVIAAGVLGIAARRTATEQDTYAPGSTHRVASEEAALGLASRGVRSSVLRLPPSVHGEGDHGFVPQLIAVAREKGVSGYPGDGSSRWPAVHRLDAARLFRLAAESAPAGSVLHGIGEEGIPTREIAAAIGRHLELPVSSIPAEEIADHFGWIGPFFAIDSAASSQWTREQLDWNPTRSGLIEDLDQGHYFEQPQEASAA